ncbi:MAG: hypothetical protein KDB63_06615 [Nocardioidaceae bacterium]|nr:hypothetical protein [Nocardioidaceae bacterium]
MHRHPGRKALAYATPLFVSTVITHAVLSVTPPHIGRPLFLSGLLIGAILLTGWAEDAAALILLLARPATRAERATLAPAVALVHACAPDLPVTRMRVRVQMLPPTNSWPVLPFARRTLLVNPALIRALQHGRLSSGQAAHVMTRAALVIDAGLTRSDAFLTYWTTPWQILAGIGEGIARALRGFPLVSFAWRARFFTIGIAVIQTIHDGPYWLAALIATIGILSYAAPAWIRHWDATDRIRQPRPGHLRDPAGLGKSPLITARQPPQGLGGLAHEVRRYSSFVPRKQSEPLERGSDLRLSGGRYWV